MRFVSWVFAALFLVTATMADKPAHGADGAAPLDPSADFNSLIAWFSERGYECYVGAIDDYTAECWRENSGYAEEVVVQDGSLYPQMKLSFYFEEVESGSGSGGMRDMIDAIGTEQLMLPAPLPWNEQPKDAATTSQTVVVKHGDQCGMINADFYEPRWGSFRYIKVPCEEAGGEPIVIDGAGGG